MSEEFLKKALGSIARNGIGQIQPARNLSRTAAEVDKWWSDYVKDLDHNMKTWAAQVLQDHATGLNETVWIITRASDPNSNVTFDGEEWDMANLRAHRQLQYRNKDTATAVTILLEQFGGKSCLILPITQPRSHYAAILETASAAL